MNRKIFLFCILAALFLKLPAQKTDSYSVPEEISADGYVFSTVIDLGTTPVKNQSATGTCWSFATTSFIESELLRKGKGEYDLSEMYIVRYNYLNRLRDYYLRHGNRNLGPGSLSHDWMKVFSEHGILPDEVYRGLNYGSSNHNHIELQVLINEVAVPPAKYINESDQYENNLNAILDTYLGEVPDSFIYKGLNYSPETFTASLDIDPDDYVQITSFTHFPFYTRGILDVPDNWAMEKFFNVPLDELIEIIDYSFNQGFTVNWDGDISESGFSHQKGYAVIPGNISSGRKLVTDRERYKRNSPPDPDYDTTEGKSSPNRDNDRTQGDNPADPVHHRTEEKSSPDRNNDRTQGDNPADPVHHRTEEKSSPNPEMTVTQKIRQEGYEKFVTTDDHMMHLTGIMKDQNGTKYYKTKNSWGASGNNFGGYLNMSENYIRAKTIYIMVNKNGVPPSIRKKLGI